VRSWTVWVPEQDDESASLLEHAGHRLDAEPAAMALMLEDWTASETAADARVEVGGAMSEVVRINDRAYGYTDEFARALAGWRDQAWIYIARDGERAVSCVVAMDHEGDCGIFFVATMPEARGRGLATALMQHALRDGRKRGCTTSTLQATKAGAPIYARLGYLNLGALQMWERRV